MTSGAKAFRNAAAFRRWLAAHHDSAAALLVRLAKTHRADDGITYAAALDEALCFGWIDGVRRRIDDDAFSIRFTPRTSKSKWSVVNVRHATRLEAAGRMHPAGLAAFRARDDAHPRRYSYEERPRRLDAAALRAFRTNRNAWTFYQAQAPWYRRVTAFWVMSAKRAETRTRRLAKLIDCSSRNRRLDDIGPPTRPS